jgi:hypothetical protein
MKVAGYTVVTPNYLAHARSVRESFLRHHPDCDFYIGVIGAEKGYPDTNKAGVHFITQINDSRLEQMLLQYSPFEMSCAIKPFFASYFFEVMPDIDRLVYLDGDILVFNSLAPFSQAPISITPHRINEIGFLPEADKLSDTSLNRYGVYNAGYFEVMKSDEGFRFLKWWKELMSQRCYNKPDEHFFVDQLWLNCLPAFFNDVYINKRPGYNVAYWNLIERHISQGQGQVMVNEQPLVFYHYSLYNTDTPDKMTNFENKFLSFENFPLLRQVYHQYDQSLLRHGVNSFKHLPYPFLQKEKPKSGGLFKKLFK